MSVDNLNYSFGRNSTEPRYPQNTVFPREGNFDSHLKPIKDTYCPPCCTSLNYFEFVYICLGLGVKDCTSIFKLGTDKSRIVTLSYIRGLYLYVPLDKAKGAVSLGSNLVYVVVPGQIVGDVYTKIASILSCL